MANSKFVRGMHYSTVVLLCVDTDPTPRRLDLGEYLSFMTSNRPHGLIGCIRNSSSTISILSYNKYEKILTRNHHAIRE